MAFRKYTAQQVVFFILSFLLPPLSIWFLEGFGVDFWINCVLLLFGFLPASIHAIYGYLVWLERKWQTRHGKEVTAHPFLMFSKEFAERSKWAGNGQNGWMGYFDDNIKGGEGRAGYVGGDVDPKQAQIIQPKDKKTDPVPTGENQKTAPAPTGEKTTESYPPAQPTDASQVV